MQESINERLQISPYMAAYVVVSMQIGIGILGFQRVIAKDAGYDAWISVLVAGLITNISLWFIFKICESVEGDVMYANVYMFGKIIGNLINIIFIFYFILTCGAILGGLIEVIRTWIFLDLNPFWFATVYLLLGIYIVYGGFRIVAGICFFGKIIPLYLVFTFGFALKYGDFTNLLPIFDHSANQLIKSGYHMSLSYLGFEELLFFYPFIKNPGQSKKWVHIGLLATTFFYTSLAVISFSYFPPGLLKRSIWATLEMWKIVRLPFIERFEYLGIANWTLLILPNVAVTLWCASRGVKRILNIRQKKAVIFIALLCLILVAVIPTRERMDLVLNLDSIVGFSLAYVYAPFLYLLLLIKKKVKAR
ncbi:GerAB/ArcD/ProY family transporter [Bacillus sp. BRMEA1]|nr:GerAB/ArcD/ProY family transporter [Neobacillus endophyticus]